MPIATSVREKLSRKTSPLLVAVPRFVVPVYDLCQPPELVDDVACCHRASAVLICDVWCRLRTATPASTYGVPMLLALPSRCLRTLQTMRSRMSGVCASDTGHTARPTSRNSSTTSNLVEVQVLRSRRCFCMNSLHVGHAMSRPTHPPPPFPQARGSLPILSEPLSCQNANDIFNVYSAWGRVASREGEAHATRSTARNTGLQHKTPKGRLSNPNVQRY